MNGMVTIYAFIGNPVPINHVCHCCGPKLSNQPCYQLMERKVTGSDSMIKWKVPAFKM